MKKPMKKKRDDHTVTPGSGNVYRDFGFPDADEMLLKARVVVLIDNTIKELGLTQKDAAKRMRIKQPDVSKMVRGHFGGFSMDRLLDFLVALGNDVEINIRRTRKETGRLTVREYFESS